MSNEGYLTIPLLWTPEPDTYVSCTPWLFRIITMALRSSFILFAAAEYLKLEIRGAVLVLYEFWYK